MIKTVLVTGGTGFIGSFVIEKLLDNNIKVILLKNSTSNTWRIDHVLSSIQSYDLDKVNLDFIFSKNNIDAIIHLATFYKKQYITQDIDSMISANITLPLKLLDLAKENQVKYFINTGTFFEYLSNGKPIKEDKAKRHPFNLYALTKICFEDMLKYYSEVYNIKSVTLKIFSPYGPKDNENKLIPSIIINSLKNSEVKLSQGLQKLDFIYVKDIAEAYIKCLKRINFSKNNFEILNIGSGITQSIREIVLNIENILGHPIKKIWGKPTKDNLKTIKCDRSKAYKTIGWTPKYKITDGLQETIDYYRGRHYDLSR